MNDVVAVGYFDFYLQGFFSFKNYVTKPMYRQNLYKINLCKYAGLNQIN